LNIRLIIPKWPEESIWSRFVFRFPYLSVTTLAALTPPDVNISITDENIEPIDFDSDIDLVGISAITPLAPRGYEIADRFRARGVKVVFGGFHASWLPEEAASHADSVVIGEGEIVWPELIEDFKKNQLKPFYKAHISHPLSGIPPARRDLLSSNGYFFKNTIQTTRGCPFDCEFCSVTAFYGRSYRCRPIEDIKRELDTIKGGANFIFFVDDNITGNPRHARQLFELLKNTPFKWLSQSSIKFADNPELLTLAKESRCYGIFIGFETLTQEGLKALNKNFNQAEKYFDAVKRFHDHGIGVLGSFVFGNDWDTKDSFDAVLEFSERAKLDATLYTILTPYPGTKIYERLKKEGRIISTDWRKYDMAHAVFLPKNFTPEELEERYLRLNRSFYSYPSMFKRLLVPRRSLWVFGPMNWGLRKIWRQFSYR